MKPSKFYFPAQAIGLLLIGFNVHAAEVDVSTTSSVNVSSPTAVEVSTVSTVSESTAPATVVQSSSGPVTLLALPDCIRLAINGATNVLLAKNQADYSGSQLLQAYMQFLPNLEASGSYAYQSGRNYLTETIPTSVKTQNQGGGYTLASTLNLFAGGADFANLKSSRALRQAADLSLVRAKQQIAFDITQAYLQVLLDRQIVLFNEANVNASKEREQLLDAQAQAGSRSLADLYRQQADSSSNELALIGARNRAKDDLILLLRRLRIDLLPAYDVADVDLDTPTASEFPDATTLANQAIQQRADLIAAERTAQAAQSGVTSARADYYPRLDLAGSLVGTGNTLVSQYVDGVKITPFPQPSIGHQWGDQILYTGGLNLNWGLFERFATNLNVARARQSAADALINSEDYRLQVEGDVQASLNDFESAIEAVTASDTGVKSAKESYDAVNARYGVGASSIVDLLTAQSAFLDAKTAEIQSRIQYHLQKRAVELAAGTLQP